MEGTAKPRQFGYLISTDRQCVASCTVVGESEGNFQARPSLDPTFLIRQKSPEMETLLGTFGGGVVGLVH